MTTKALTKFNQNELISAEVASAILGVSVGTLTVWRSTGRYCLPFVKVGRLVRYRLSDLEDWLDKRSRMSGTTS